MLLRGSSLLVCSGSRFEYAAPASFAWSGSYRRVTAGWLRCDSHQRQSPFLRHGDGRATVVPAHAGETVGPGLMNKILKDVEMDSDEFKKWL
jgi:predicted RNA binding protein YcfA (HicA-like mRNA interferase family)